MKIYINYEASWSNSFLDGDNNSPSVEFNIKKDTWQHKKQHDRKYICSSTALGKKENFIKSEITHNTVMGLLNLLIGDQRKLWQSRVCDDYFYKDIESRVTFVNNIDIVTNELVYLNNKDSAQDRSRLKKSNNADVSEIFNSVYSNELWSVLYMSIDELTNYILNGVHIIKTVPHTSVDILYKIDELEKPVVLVDDTIRQIYGTVSTIVDPDTLKAKTNVNQLYFIGLRRKVSELLKIDPNILQGLLSLKVGVISGLYIKQPSINQFTKKTGLSGSPQTVKGNPYKLSRISFDMDPTDYLLSKKDGQLIINIDVNEEVEQTIKYAIEAAQVSTFYVGKKGLAYVNAII